MRASRGALISICVLGLATVLLIAAAPPVKEPKAEPAGEKAKVRVVEIKLKGSIAEQAEAFMPFGPRPVLLRDITASIRKAAKDDSIKAILLRMELPGLGLAKLQELADAIKEFRGQNKRVYCYADACDNLGYLLACSADRIASPPSGMLGLTGLATEAMFLKGLLDWAGIKADILNTGPNKSAGDMLTRDSMSEENRKVLNELLDDLYGQFVDTIAGGRRLTAAEVREIIDAGPFDAREAWKRKLIDDVAYYSDFVDAMGKELGGTVDLVRDYHHLGRKGPDLSEFNIFTFFAALRPQPDIPRTPRPKVVVLYASGVIGAGASLFGGSGITEKEVAKALKAAREDDTVKAVVLRVDSPGGSALTSDLIWNEIERTRKAGKPVVASMSDVAASGGYYIAMGADAIVAQPGTLTGSIGVIGGKMVLRGLYDKLGIKKEVFTRGKNAALFSDYSDFSEAEQQRVRAVIDSVLNEFVQKAAEGRHMAPEKMRELATGRVWTGRAALKAGLVDKLGGLKEAFDLAVDKAGLQGQDVQPVVLPREKSILEALFEGPSARSAPAIGGMPVPGPLLRTLPYAAAIELLARENALVLMPYFLEIR